MFFWPGVWSLLSTCYLVWSTAGVSTSLESTPFRGRSAIKTWLLYNSRAIVGLNAYSKKIRRHNARYVCSYMLL